MHMLVRQLHKTGAATICVLIAASPAHAASSGESFSSVIRDPAKLLSFLGSTMGRSLLVFLFFLAIVLLLRYLLGPGGKLRDPKWDSLNAQERERERVERNVKTFRSRLRELAPAIEPETEIFRAYVSEFLTGDATQDAMYLLKQEHCLNVLGHALSIAAQEDIFLPDDWRPLTHNIAKNNIAQNSIAPSNLAQSNIKDESDSGPSLPCATSASTPIAEPDRILLLAALYHDLGRFEQLKRYNTFRDADSINHAELGAQLLLELKSGNAPRFMPGEPEKSRALVREAVLAHNRFALSPEMEPHLAAISHAVRDADKLDILRVMAAELAPGKTPDPTVVLGLADEPDKCTQAVIDAVQESSQVKYSEMRYVNDFRLLLCSWLDNIAYPASLRILAKNGHLESIVDGLPHTPQTEELIHRVRERLNEISQTA
ncbi:HD domain-containing protein [Desulfovibrio sp. OttesenSCG-928-C06]|nr:HD domain-containing protein [Desulfovibrio sp. OttesenSCG-928-C06]